MRILILSDIHANLTALETVLADAAGQYDRVWCLGDLVGYGPDPNECVDCVRGLQGLLCLVGNHDKAVLGEIDLAVFNGDAHTAISWTRRTASPETLDYLRALPAQDQAGDYTLVHGSPRQPVWEYILDCFIARDNFRLFSTPYCLVGHTHVPVIFRETGARGECREEVPDYGVRRPLAGQRLILNPGSVGQPRDGRPDAAYMILDSKSSAATLTLRRVAYPVATVQQKMRDAGLPQRLITRLTYGW
jgi:diadenosine tetraphosphatase ApaH/serine/threonine PP2A family protein phosphatase